MRSGRGRTRTVISVSTPSVPNDPHISFATSKPVTFLITRPPARITSPAPLTNLQPITWSRAPPDFTRRGPHTSATTTPASACLRAVMPNAGPQSQGSNGSICEFDAGMQRRKHLAGIEQRARVEGAFQALLLRQIGIGKHLTHQRLFFDANAMFAGEHAAHLDTKFQNIGAE